MEQPDSPPSGGGPLKKIIFFVMVLSGSAAALSAQNETGSELDFLDQEYRKESLREMALEEIANAEYEQALDHLNAALSLSPEDRELQDLKKSVADLILLEKAHEDASVLNPEEPGFSNFIKPDDEVIISPDFAQELLTDAQRDNPSVKRNAFSLEIGSAYGQTEALYLTDQKVLDTDFDVPSNPYNRISAEAQAFFVPNKRNLGLGIRYKDVPYNRNNVDMLERIFDVSLHYRGFFAESLESRLVLGVRGGVGFLGIKEDKDEDNVADGDVTNPLIFIGGVYFSDALFRYLFKDSTFFKRFIIEMNFDFIFVSSIDDISLSEYSISGGYQFTDNFSFFVFSEAFNTTSNFQNSSSWEIGGRVKLSY